MVKRKGLGRGLDALLGVEESSSTSEAGQDNEHLKELPVEFMRRGKYQPRRDMHPEALEELADSIRAQGVMQPIVVRSLGEDSYEIIAGERRWRASQLAGLETIPALIRNVSDESAMAMALIENIQREDLNAMEEAQALIRLQEEFGLTQQQIAQAVGKSRSSVANFLRLTALTEEVQKLLEHGDLEMGHAKVLLGLEGDRQIEAARQAVARGMSVRQIEDLVKRMQHEQNQPEKTNDKKTDPDIRRLEERLEGQLSVPVRIEHSTKGKGRLVLKYNSLDELEGILDHIK
ncbi:ParB/RepB/Spo0J family partition protein [Porticoccus litoralis]|uniref:Probable chromosome-partitioning protein ParB n=1 Tax=Porticoccus litoralis TaxID=434086 RepID=A0AAW8B2D8_9GAMM|nr:ParB/RepB/Spo0J family partition protein [Porticoccus litoralis]MDP1520761.1 ParB/RepB/Spo0J family partition protein [Porticoccus litoralis]